MKDKVIVVTGGTKGIGRELALRCADIGAKVSIAGRSKEEGEAIVNEINKKNPGNGLYVKSDLTNVKECENFISETVKCYGEIDGLVNYAGILPVSSIIETEEKLFDEIFDLNIKAAFFCTKFAMISMLKKGGGSIVNIGSPHGYAGQEDRAPYAVSKGALLALNRHVSKNYGKHNIRANWISMGWVPTPGELALRATQGRDLEWLKAEGKKAIPMGRLQTVEDHIPIIISLLSDETSQVTGSEIHVTGGLVH